jgi:hypothetical protein
MPVLFNPKTYEERDLWMRACAAQAGENVEGLSKCQKMRIRKRFYVLNGNLIDKFVRDERGVERPVFILSSIRMSIACRYETAYGEHEAMGNTICKCNLTSKGHCLNKKQCPCFKANLKCSSKCHLGKVCDLPK